MELNKYFVPLLIQSSLVTMRTDVMRFGYSEAIFLAPISHVLVCLWAQHDKFKVKTKQTKRKRRKKYITR